MTGISPISAPAGQPPLAVDLDGTLVKTDLLVESVIALLKCNPGYMFFLPWWLRRGKAYLKQQIAQRVALDIAVLPYHRACLAYLNEQHAQGRRLILTTACSGLIARQVAEHLKVFSDVWASDELVNFKGERKRQRLVTEFGPQSYDYVGSNRADVPVWRSARKAVLVAPKPRIREAAARLAEVEEIFEDRQRGVKLYLHALRMHQWLKNLLVFIPLLAAHRFGEGVLVFQASLAFLAFGSCASSAYVLNDLLDLPTDRRHPRKCRRPFAHGDLPVLHGLILIPALLGLAAGLALPLSIHFAAILAFYFALTVAYSLYLKRIVLLDILVLAGLYTVRIIAGSTAVLVWPSFWLLAFSMFLFLSIAMVKRYTELVSLQIEGGQNATGRGYQVGDVELLASMGVASGYMAVLVLALYINSDAIKPLYSRPELVWLLCPLLLYWISRVWLIAHRGAMHEDPVVFALQDRVSHVIVLSVIIVLALAT